MKVSVIGGGPGGLATLKFLSTAHHFPIAPIDARLFEAEDQIGGTFVHRVYEDAEVCTSRLQLAAAWNRIADVRGRRATARVVQISDGLF